MATPVGRLVQDQNLNVHPTGALLRGKVDVSKPTKKGVPGGRRALNDISNSGKPSAVQPSTKIKSGNVVPTGKDLGVSKANPSKNQGKGKASGRKALGDLTNTVKPSLHHSSVKIQDKKSSVTGGDNIPSCIEEEGFLHNHEECLKAQRETMRLDYFLETIGLGNGSSLVIQEPWELKPESLEMEEMPSPKGFSEDEVDKTLQQPAFPDSPILKPYENYWKDEEFLDFKLIDSPKAKKF